MTQALTIEVPAVFKPLDQSSRYKGLHGGRGSGKSWHAGQRCLCCALAWYHERLAAQARPQLLFEAAMKSAALSQIENLKWHSTQPA